MKDKQIVSVSIIAANFNNGCYLADFIESIVNSTVQPLELILIDDGSTDNSLQILKNYAYLEFLRVVSFPANKGLTASLNTGIELAKGEFIMRADPDDIFLPDRIEKQVAFLKAHPHIDGVGCNVIYFNSITGNKINTSNFPLNHEDILSTYRKGEHGLQHPTVCLRGQLFRQYRYQPIFPGEDYELFSRILNDGYTFANLKEALYLMRIHAGSSTSNLKIGAIRQTFQFRDQLFGTKTNPVWIWIYYNHIRHYRNYQMKYNPIAKTYHLVIASILYPAKILKQLKKHFASIKHLIIF